jgi:hypothetical protein
MMTISVKILPAKKTKQGFAPVSLLKPDGRKLCQLDIEYSKLTHLNQENTSAIDFLLIASTVYSLDKLINRETGKDNWTREFSVTIPVSKIDVWNKVKVDLDRCLSFLTGDNWDMHFVSQESTPVRPIPPKRGQRIIIPTGNAISLFSGGLDSLVGVIDWLASHPDQKLVVVGHHDAKMPGPFDDQKKLLEKLCSEYPKRIHDILVRVGHDDEIVKKTEITLRGRSLIFIALGIFVASSFGPSIPLLIPENGTIALNVPLTPSRRGSCSTRTAHPYYLTLLSRVLNGVGLTNPIINPLELKTKGEAVEQCLNPTLLQRAALESVSCAKRGHKKHFTHRDAKSCGRCMPCIYRRAALHKNGLDTERYGDDFCQGEVPILQDEDKSKDIRACFSFLNLNPSIDEISTRLLANGSLDSRQLQVYAEMVQRSMDEIRALIRDKAISDIKRQAGVS